MNYKRLIFALVMFLYIPLVHASPFDRIGNIWQTVLYIGGLGFLNLPGSNDLILFLRFSIFILVFSVFFALGVFVGKGKAQFLTRKFAGIIAFIFALLSVIFIPTQVLIAIAGSLSLLTSLVMLAAPLIAIIFLVLALPHDECYWYGIKFILCAIILWIINAQAQHLKAIATGTMAKAAASVTNATDWVALLAILLILYYFIRWLFCIMSDDSNIQPVKPWNPFKPNPDDPEKPNPDDPEDPDPPKPPKPDPNDPEDPIDPPIPPIPPKPRGKASLSFYMNRRRHETGVIKHDLTRKNAIAVIEIKQDGTGGYASYSIKSSPYLMVITEKMSGYLSVKETLKIIVKKREGAFTLDEKKLMDIKKHRKIIIRATEGKSHHKKDWKWFHKNKRWHYEINFKVHK